jgi:SH3-like domain-containing protein
VPFDPVGSIRFIYESKRMTRRVPFAALLLASLLGAGAAHAEFKSVGAAPAVAYDAPSDKARKVFVVPRGMPAEIILTQNGWSKVRDSAGDLYWLEAKSLTTKHNVIVTAPSLKLHATADDASATVATIDKGVLLELVAAPSSGWVKLKHRDGPTGFAKIGEVWGE